MKLFLKQLWLLLWKNFKTRKRQIFRNIVEILWPLAIFVILVAVRHKRPPEHFPEHEGVIHFPPRALPSAGALPFLQSLFCDFDASKWLKKPQDLPNFWNSLLGKFTRTISPLLANETRLNLLIKLTNLTRIVNQFNSSEIPVTTLFGSANETRQLLSGFLSDNTSRILSRSRLKLEGFLEVSGFTPTNYVNLSTFFFRNPEKFFEDIKVKFCGGNDIEKVIDFPVDSNVTAVKKDICNVNISAFIESSAYTNISSRIRRRGELIFEEVMVSEREVKQFLNNMTSIWQVLQNNISLNSSSPFNLNMRVIICGDEEQFHSNKNNSFTTANPTVTIKTSPVTTNTQETTATSPKPTMATTTSPNPTSFPDHGGGKNATCNKINPEERYDCGWGGITEENCIKMGCCYDSSIEHTKYCFCPTTNQSSCCYKRRRFINLIVGYAGGFPQLTDFLTSALERPIMFTPNNSKTHQIINKISGFLNIFVDGLKSAGTARDLIMNWLNVVEEILKDNQQITYVEKIARIFLEIQQNPLFQRWSSFIPDINNTYNVLAQLMQFGSDDNKDMNLKRIGAIKSLINDFVDALEGFSECYNISIFKAMPSEEALVNEALNSTSVNFLSSIVFLNVEEDQPFPKNIEYKLRYNPDYTPSTARIVPKYWKPGPGPYGTRTFWHYTYINFGFVFLQDMVERALIEILANKTILEPGLYLQQFPYPCYISDRFMYALGNSLPLFMTLAWIYTVAMIVKSIVYEKEMRLKEVMKVMGLTNSVHWMAWFITSFISMAITIVTLVTLLKIGNILIYSDITVVIFVLLVFASASIAMAFLISVFFGRANISAACGGIIYFFTYLPYPLTLWFEDQMNFSAKGAVSLLSTTSFGLSIKYIARWEEQGIGAQWSNFYDNPMVSDTFSLGWSVNFMLIDICLYIFLMWYFEHVLPGQYGIPRPFYFLFTKSYWIEKSWSSKVASEDVDGNMCMNGLGTTNDMMYNESEEEENQPRTDKSGKFEADYSNALVGVHIQNLVKVYSRGNKRAVDGLNLKFYEGHVTALLGHNGAGKSTTMSILTGLFPPTSGTAIVNGYDIRTNIGGVRKSLGLCPQHNVLFDNLTVEEHMWFYGKLKGIDSDSIKKEIERFLVDVGLPEKRDELSCNLSGGMKRKLSVAMAFIAESKTVILDEPTSGVDPYSRRSIWDLILKHKKGRTVLLSTHYMDEADLLGDRVSIISNGRLQCSGTPLFLKRRFGKGYFLIVTRDNNNQISFDPFKIKNFISSFIPGTKLHENFGSEVTFILPSAARLTGEFSNLFQNLEENLPNLGIQHYGISDTTLEEVFLKACDEDQMEMPDEDTISLTGPLQRRRNLDDISIHSTCSQSSLLTENHSDDIKEMSQQTLLWGPILWMQQFKAIIIKRFHHARRSKKGFFSQILLPAIFVIAAMVVSLIRPPRVALPSLKLTTGMFDGSNYVVIENKDENPFSNNLMNGYVSNPGLGPDCVKLPKAEPTCPNINIIPFLHHNMSLSKAIKDLPSCSCSTGKQQCPKDAYGPEPPQQKVATGDIVIDLTGRDMNDYVVKTTDRFIRQRFGGASFGEGIFELSDAINMTNMLQASLLSSFGVRRNAKVWHNMKGYHAMPTFINVMNNAILRASLNSTVDKTKYSITAYNHPMDFNKDQLAEETMRQGIVGLFVAIFVILALAFVPASFLVYLVEDRVSKSKHLQLVSGLNPIVYWFSNFVWDMINYLIPASCCILIFLIFDQEAYVSSQNLGATILLLILYGWSMTPLMYPASFVFNVPSTAYIVLIAINLFVGIIGTVATFILEFFSDGDQELTDINHVLKRVLLIFPNYCLGRGLMDLAGNQLKADAYQRINMDKFKNPFEWDMIGRNVFAMFFSGIIYMVLNILIQYRFFVKPRTSKINRDPKHSEEEDVRNERHRIFDEINSTKYILKTDNLTKLYASKLRKRNTLAVDRLNFGVEEGECFGLLGVNGAGKTSTFKMLTGDANVSAGDAFINGNSVCSEMNKARKYMGYCPQFDALDELLTGKELLQFYAEIRGMSRQEGAKMAEWAIEKLGLTPYKNKICGDYSGGNKRKLSTAIALIGSPPLIFLDEPTTGMDPGARRFLWSVLTDLLKSGKSIVLTSHSMEECETLCTRLAIMVNGEFKCLGSPQHLRSKFGTGYTVIIRAKIKSTDSVQEFVEANFVDAKLRDRHQYMLEYQIPTRNLQLSQVFQKLELLRKTKTIEDYSVTQTTLDQIFVNFARNQVEAVQINEDVDMMPVASNVIV